MILGVDVDLTVVDTLSGLMDYVSDLLPNLDARLELQTKINEFIKLNDTYKDFHNLLDEILAKYGINATAKDYWRNPKLYDDLLPFPDAVEVLNWFNRNGTKIVFITSIIPEHYQSKINFILRYFPYTYDFITAQKKYLVGNLDMFIDDNIMHIDDFLGFNDFRIHCFLYRTLFNAMNKKYKTYSWKEIQQTVIKEKIPTKSRVYFLNSKKQEMTND